MSATPPPTPEEPHRASPPSGAAGGGSKDASKGASKGVSPGSSKDASQGRPAEVTPPVPLTQQLGRVTIVVLAVLFGVFAVANSQRVDFSWVFGETLVRPDPGGGTEGGVPLILLLVAAFVLGAVITALLELYVARVRRARRARRSNGQGSDRS